MDKLRNIFSHIFPDIPDTAAPDIFDAYIHLARNILDGNRATGNKRHGINKLLKILSLKIQLNLIESCLAHEGINYQKTIPFLFFPRVCSHCGKAIHTVKREDYQHPQPFNISLNPALTFPHDRNKLVSNLCNIGSAIGVPFQYDKYAHVNAATIAPINLFICGEGFHSTLSGIFDTEAMSYAQGKLDLSDTYIDIYFDGKIFRHKLCGKPLGPPCNQTSGLLYEIGRLLTEYSLDLTIDME